MDPARYHRLQLLLGLAGFAITVAFLLACLVGGVGPAVARAARAIHHAPWWQVAFVAAVVGAGHALLTLPLGWVRGYHLPRRYGLLHQTLSGWLADRVKASAIAAILAFGTLELVYGLVTTTAWWWLAAAAALIVLEVVLAFVFPVWLMPLFYRLAPLGAEPLGSRLLELARRAGVGAIGVWVADQSRKSRTANAVLTGLGRTRRIVLFDTLVSRFEPREIEAVLAHELAHHAHHDVWRGLALQATVTVVALWVADHLLTVGVRLFGLEGPGDPAGLPWLVLILLGVGAVTTPLVNAVSRLMERQADDFALALTADVEGFVCAMERLATLNLAERRPHPVKELLLYSHPSIDRRIARARGRAVPST